MTSAQARIKHWRQRPEAFVFEQFGIDPDRWQVEVLQAFADPSKQRISLQACAGPGKLQPKSMMLYTPKGLQRWGDLKVGDYLFAEDGTPTKIKGVYDNGLKSMWRVCFNDGSSTLAGSEHLWKVRGRTEQRYRKDDRRERSSRSKTYSERNRTLTTTPDHCSILTTDELRARLTSGRRDELSLPCHGPVTYLTGGSLPVPPYVLGVWLGDGTRLKPQYTGLDEEIDACIQALGFLVIRRGKTVSVRGLTQPLRSAGVLDKYSYERRVPERYRLTSSADRLWLLQGLMDADGCIGTDGHCEFSTSSFGLAEDVVWLVRSLGGKAKIKDARTRKGYRSKSGEYVLCRVSYRVTVTMPQCPFRLQRKAARWSKPSERYLARYIVKIEPAPAEDAMCVMVDHPSGCYLANDFIVTHNTAVLAWCAWNFLTCYAQKGEHPKGAAVSITSDNLKDNLWPELAKWQGRSEFLKAAFTWTKERIFANDHPETWFFSARSWPKNATPDEQGKTLSGLHSKFVLAEIDESGAIPTTVLRAADQALSNCVFGKILQAGNPISLEGMLYAASTQLAHLWHVIRVTGDPDDPMRSPRIDLEWARRQIDTYGRENPWVLSYILGRFPPSSLNSLLGPEEVQAAMKLDLPPDAYQWAQARLGVDVARFGDDRTVIFPRQGKRAYLPDVMRHARDSAVSTNIATAVLKRKQQFKADCAVIMDATGGWAAGARDVLMASDYMHAPVNVQFHTAGMDPRYKNRRAEMWFAMAEWVKAGGSLPNLPELVGELSAPTYTFVNGKFQLEPKDQVKERLGRSPDLADALALTFGLPEMAPQAYTESRVARPISGSSFWGS